MDRLCIPSFQHSSGTSWMDICHTAHWCIRQYLLTAKKVFIKLHLLLSPICREAVLCVFVMQNGHTQHTWIALHALCQVIIAAFIIIHGISWHPASGTWHVPTRCPAVRNRKVHCAVEAGRHAGLVAVLASLAARNAGVSRGGPNCRGSFASIAFLACSVCFGFKIIIRASRTVHAPRARRQGIPSSSAEGA